MKYGCQYKDLFPCALIKMYTFRYSRGYLPRIRYKDFSPLSEVQFIAVLLKPKPHKIEVTQMQRIVLGLQGWDSACNGDD